MYQSLYVSKPAQHGVDAVRARVQQGRGLGLGQELAVIRVPRGRYFGEPPVELGKPALVVPHHHGQHHLGAGKAKRREGRDRSF